MKKKILLALLLVGGVALTTNVNAMTEAELKAKLTQSYTVNGKTQKVDSSLIAQIDRYFNEYEVSAEDCDYIAGKIDEALEIVKANKATKWSELSAANVEKLVAITNDITEKTTVNVSLSNKGQLTIYEEDGETVFTKVTDLIKYTDGQVAITVAIGSISLIGLLVIIKKVVKANA